jgi:hypothetical protein
MKFKFIYLPDDNPDDHARAWESGPAEPASPRGELRYENDGTDMVRREQLANGRSRCTAAANFQARIVRDIILDDGTEERREFGMEAELGGRRVTFVVAAAEFGRMGWVLSRLGRKPSSTRGNNSTHAPPSSICPVRSLRNGSSPIWAGGSTAGSGYTCMPGAP